MNKRYFFYLLLLLGIKTLAMTFVILHAGIGLGPDEAQYWTWSRELDWGYYSKPPGIAWEIWLGTSLFGNTELGVRAMALALGVMIPTAVYLLAHACRMKPRTCFWAGAAMALSPMGILASFLAITDGGMIFFWTAACIYMAWHVERRRMPSYVILGLLILGGGLFKWPIYFFWIAVLGSWWFFPWLASWKIAVGFLVSLGAFLPSFYWNATHEWATFRHVLSTMMGGHGGGKAGGGGNFFEFLGSQAALISPIFFILFLMGLWSLFKNRREDHPGVLFCGGVSFIALIGGLAASIVMKIQGNWAIFAYPTAFVVMSWYCCERLWGGKWMKAGALVSIVLCVVILSIPTLQSQSLLSRLAIPYKWNSFRHNVGWEQMKVEIEKAGYNPDQDFLFGDKYQTASILSFYSPKQKRAYFFNLQGTRKNQFSFWPQMHEEQKGRRGFFVAAENIPQLNNLEQIEHYQHQLEPYFEKVLFLGIKPIFFAYGTIAKGVLIFECQNYRGGGPIDPALY